jgi:hypothetical protein
VAAPVSPLTQLNSPPQRRTKSARSAPVDSGGYQDRYRLHVVATNIADVVTSIGGLIFDRAMAGWDVTVTVDGNADDRAIRILGGRVAKLAAGPDGTGSAPRPQVLAVATDVFVANEPVRRLVLAARKSNAADVLLWPRGEPSSRSRSTRVSTRWPDESAPAMPYGHSGGRASQRILAATRTQPIILAALDRDRGSLTWRV